MIQPLQLALFLFLIVIIVLAIARSIKNRRMFTGISGNVFSKILNQKQKIRVYAPQVTDNQSNSKQYPVVYLLDGDKHFSHVTDIIKKLHKREGGKALPQMIVVGIHHTNRLHDLTPTNSLYAADGKKLRSYKPTGGGEKFMAFIEKELMPYVEALYPTSPHRILIGHSVGGLTVMNILVNQPDLFDAYVSVDPSMWWDDRKVLHQAAELLKKKRFDGKSLYLAIANTRPAGMDIEQLRKDTSGRTNHARSILELADILDENKDNGLHFVHNYYENHNHGSVVPAAIYDALRFLGDGGVVV